MNWRCAECGPDVPYGDDDLMCPVHMGELVPEELLARPKPPQDEEGTPCGTSGRTGPGPASDGARAWDRSRCWYCVSVPPAETNAECLTCHKALVPPRSSGAGPAVFSGRRGCSVGGRRRHHAGQAGTAALMPAEPLPH